MEYIIEFIFELILEGSIELSQSKKVPKIIRYPLIVFICLLFLAVFFSIITVGIFVLKKSLILGIFLILIGILFLIMSIIKFRKIYILKKDKNTI